MKQGILLKLLAINVPVVALVILVLWLVLDTLAADYFSVLMKEYRISPTDAHQMFIHSVHRYLLLTSVGALVLAALLSYLLTEMVLRPLYQMIKTTRLISGGDYSSRVRSNSRDEIGELANAFNHMAASLERVEQLRRDMVSNVAHELRTPLTNIRGYLEALQDGVVPPTQETFQLLLEETLRLILLVESLLQLAKADAARFSLDLEEIDIAELSSHVLKKFDLEFKQKNIQVMGHLSETGTQVLADREKLSRVIENLLKNALQYTPERGSVSVRTESFSHGVKFLVENSGPGIEARDLPLIFERFYRGEKSRSRDYGGTGIGLAIVKEIVEAHGGKAFVESTPGKTLFWFSLPLGDRSGTICS
jgi:two-component system, OmpR family, sensor histidine kinase BaeS